MNQDPRTMTQRVHSVLHTATAALDLPLDNRQLEALAVHLAPVVRAWRAEASDDAAADAPVPYAVATTTVDREAGVETTEYAGCVSRIGVNVDLDSPAAVLAEELRRHHDVVMTDVPTAVYLGLTIRPHTAAAWKWWLNKLAIAETAVTVQGTNAHASSEVRGVMVHLCGEDTGTLLSSDVHTRQGLDVDLDSPAGTVAAKARRQPDVTAIEIRDAHTVTVTVRATSLVEWQWWLTQLAVDPGTVTFDGTTALATSRKDGAIVHLRGDDCAGLYEDQASARLVGLIGSTWP